MKSINYIIDYEKYRLHATGKNNTIRIFSLGKDKKNQPWSTNNEVTINVPNTIPIVWNQKLKKNAQEVRVNNKAPNQFA